MTIKEQLANNTLRTVSLFSGAGGLDIGAIRAGAKVIWANDMKTDACKSYQKNIGEHIKQGDINSYLDEISTLQNISLVIGGPPCQGFSVAGKMDATDERSQLIWSYTEVVERLRPQAFIMENVKALATLSRWELIRSALLLRLRKAGYSVGFIVLNASDYNVPQARERVFFIGFKGDSSIYPDLQRMMVPYAIPAPSVRKALSVLDRAGTGNNTKVCRAKITLSKSPIMRKSAYAGMLFNGLGRPIKIDGYCATLPASMGGNKTPIIDEEALYNEAYPWVEWYHKQLEADIRIAEHSTPPVYLRRLTVNEASLLQTFPVDYTFCGSQSSQYTQIGNAVPCDLAYAVCRMVIDVLEDRSPILNSDSFYSI